MDGGRRQEEKFKRNKLQWAGLDSEKGGRGDWSQRGSGTARVKTEASKNGERGLKSLMNVSDALGAIGELRFGKVRERCPKSPSRPEGQVFGCMCRLASKSREVLLAGYPEWTQTKLTAEIATAFREKHWRVHVSENQAIPGPIETCKVERFLSFWDALVREEAALDEEGIGQVLHPPLIENIRSEDSLHSWGQMYAYGQMHMMRPVSSRNQMRAARSNANGRSDQ
jgi:hypothetical protein